MNKIIREGLTIITIKKFLSFIAKKKKKKKTVKKKEVIKPEISSFLKNQILKEGENIGEKHVFELNYFLN